MSPGRGVATAFAILVGLALLLAACAGGDSGEEVDDDSGHDEDDDSDDDDDDEGADAAYAEAELDRTVYVQPDLPINAYHIAGTHNTYIWNGPQAGPTSVVASLGPVLALDKAQLVLELDVSGSLGSGDFFLDHGGWTHAVRLSSVLRTLRWWSDTHPDHEMIVVGFEWNAGTGDEQMQDLADLLDRFLVDGSAMTESGPLYDLEEWRDEITANLSADDREWIADLDPAELVLVLGYPTIRELRGRVLLEANGEVARTQRTFVWREYSGQFDNNSEDVLEDLEALAAIRLEQRVARVYPAGTRIDSSNYDIFTSLSRGVGLSAMNHQCTSAASPEVYVFLDERAPGYAPAGFVEQAGNEPTRLGPLVFVTAFAAPDDAEVAVALEFDPSLGIHGAPVSVATVVARGLAEDSVSIQSPDVECATVLRRFDDPAVLTFAVPSDVESVTVELELDGDAAGYEVHAYGPTLSGMTLDVPAAEGGGAVYTSPTFTPIDLVATGNCTVLGPGGARGYGETDGVRCGASDNPSFLVEVEFGGGAR